jgi:hypothetical protein
VARLSDQSQAPRGSLLREGTSGQGREAHWQAPARATGHHRDRRGIMMSLPVNCSLRGGTPICCSNCMGGIPTTTCCGLRVVTGQSSCPGPIGARMAMGAWYLAPGGRECLCPPADLA